MMAQKLAGLNSRLSALRWRRWIARVADGGMALGLLLVALLAGEFLLDWEFRFGRGQRGVMLVAVGLLALWGLRRFVWPALASCESIIDMALAVERRQGIDSDLVAALQFDSAGAKAWGSTQLETAVVDRAAALGKNLPSEPGDSDVRLRRKAIPLAIAVVALVCAAAVYPGHFMAFFNRFVLGSAHYPTQTMIKRIVINGAEAPAGADVKVPFSPGLRFEIESSGVAPDAGEVRLFAEEGGAATSVLLRPGASSDMFTGELAFMPESAVYQVFLGDAWSEPGTIRAIVPPVVSMELGHTPPAFASQGRASRHAIGSRQISVMEGSRVSLAVRCANKPLAQAELIIGEARFALSPQDEGKRVWQAPAGTPLDEVTVATPFEVVVVDEDGLSPDQPLRGQIHIEVDRAPRVAWAVVTSKVLPGARPSIVWGAADDNGLAEIRLIRQVTRAAGEVEESTVVIRKVDERDQPLATLRARYVLDLKPLGLAKGDEVRVTLEALDYRGKRPGATARGEPIILTVTDESGILAGLVEADEKSARQLDQIIQRQLGIGEAR
ncbi:MAG: hypothetical protein HY290_28920 [Planctomycetia bacterium]|nr:hypothetical protein [Planctomycetia bacterium]